MVKLTDVARAAGVGYGTASRAMSGRGYVDPDTRQRVISTAAQLGYRPDAAARALRERRTRTIGLIVPDIVNEFYTASAEVLAERLVRSGYQLVVATTGNDARREREALQSMLDRQVDGIVHVPVVEGASEGISVPLVELNRTTGRLSITSDDVNGVAELTNLIVDEGHKSIVAITGPSTLSTSRERVAGVVATMERRGYLLDPSASLRYKIIVGPYSTAGGVAAIRSLGRTIPDAVIALSSRIALGVLEETAAQGIAIPDRLALAAYGDPAWFSVWQPGITTFAPALAEMGSLAADALLAELELSQPGVSTRVAGRVQVRGTHLRVRRRH